MQICVASLLQFLSFMFSILSNYSINDTYIKHYKLKLQSNIYFLNIQIEACSKYVFRIGLNSMLNLPKEYKKNPAYGKH